MAKYFRSVSVRITEPVPGRFYWTIVENLGVATKFNELAAASEPFDTWEDARQAGVAELHRREPELWADLPQAGHSAASLAPAGPPAQSTGMTHPTIELFQERATLLDLQRSEAGLDDAIAELAAWMGLAADHLTEDDLTVLAGIGGVLYREGLRRRQT